MASAHRGKRQVPRLMCSSGGVGVQKERSCGWWCWGRRKDRAASRAGDPIPRVSQSPSFLQHYYNLSMALLRGLSSPKSPVHLYVPLPFWISLTCIPVTSWKQLVSRVHGTVLREISALISWEKQIQTKKKYAVYAIAFSLAEKWLSDIKS